MNLDNFILYIRITEHTFTILLTEVKGYAIIIKIRYVIFRGYSMLKILDEKVLKTDDEIDYLYKNCKYLYTIDSYDKLEDREGYLYCVSTSESSYNQLYDERDKLREEGKICVVGGSYNDGGAVGVQYEYDK